MLYTITFNELSAILVDFVDSGDGFLFLRMVGPEPGVNAIWAKLSGREGRGKKWSSEVRIPIPGRSYADRVAAQKHITYRTLRIRLPSGLIDLALIHPLLTVAEDSERGFYLLSYDDDIPVGFFARLNQSLSIPLKVEWAIWLWEAGQQPQSRLTLETSQVREGGQLVEKTRLVETTETPITRLNSLGMVQGYVVHCEGRYREAWLQLIRDQLQLGTVLHKVSAHRGRDCYRGDPWSVTATADGWTLHQDETLVLQAPSLNHLLTQARETLGVHFLIQEETNVVSRD